MMKWIFLIVFLALTPPSIYYALDDRGHSIADFIPAIGTFIALIFATLSFFRWRKVYQANKTKASFLVMILPIVAIIIFAVCSFTTYRKVNKPYQLFATFPGDHNYEYYFRDDGSLKIIGHFVMNVGQTFQSYHFERDTLFLDTIIPCTGIVSKTYTLSSSSDPRYDLLTPINENGKEIHSMSLYVQNPKR
jgi:multisubunit Na+/H+ antiporter MnhG subunit